MTKIHQFAGIICVSAGLAGAADVSFNRDVRPILSENCFNCHGPSETGRKASLRLDLGQSAFQERDGVRAIVPGKPQLSELLRRVSSPDPDYVMPPPESRKTPLKKNQIELLRNWIEKGAEYEGHWSFLPPRGRTAGPLRELIDHEVRQRLRVEGFKASSRASRETLIRRLSLHLRGLPPTIEEIDAFLADKSDTAWETLVDQFLSSPECAERLALGWLDVARYSDTNGYSIDDHRDMWGWRDWVIHAFMQNKPYDEFIVEQLAGDLLPNSTPEQKMATGFLRNSMNTHEGGTIAEEYRVAYIVDKIDTVASTFMGLTLKCAQCHDHKYDPISQKDYYRFYAFFNDASEDGTGAQNGNTEPVIQVTSPLQDQAAFESGLKMRIDRLKYLRAHLSDLDPEGYERWKAEVLAKAGPVGEHGVDPWEKLDGGNAAEPSLPVLADLLRKPPAERTAAENKQVSTAFVGEASRLVKRFEKALGIELGVLEKQLEEGKTSVMVMDTAKPRKTRMLIRGQYDQLGEEVTAGVPVMFPQLPEDVPADRLALARWLVDEAHPLTARVTVNRYWQMIFGTGLVKTSEDFGSQGEWPSHSELLDGLAIGFREGGWNLRQLLKEIVMSETYRQRSEITPALQRIDSYNRLLARAPRQRLSAELVRDNALAISGLLHKQVGGPSVYPLQPDGLWRQVSHFGYGAFTAQAYFPGAGDHLVRRSVYTFWKRTAPPPGMAIFDAPTRETCTMRRLITNTPLQALVLMNDPQFLDAARALAGRMMKEGGKDAAQRIRYAFRLATARHPTAEELAIMRAGFVREQKRFAADPDAAADLLGSPESSGEQVEVAAYTMVASTILNLNETITTQ